LRAYSGRKKSRESSSIPFSFPNDNTYPAGTYIVSSYSQHGFINGMLWIKQLNAGLVQSNGNSRMSVFNRSMAKLIPLS